MSTDIRFERLKGRANYNDWKRSMLAFLRTKKLSKCIDETNTETDTSKLEETMGWLVLAVEPNVANHFDDAMKPVDVWKMFRTSFAESGIDREVTALMDLTGIRLADCKSMDDYIGQMMNAWKRCTEASIKLDDRLVALLMLGKLGAEYQPFIMGLTASGTKVTVENVKSSLLSLVPTTTSPEAAFFSSSHSGGKAAHASSSKKVPRKIKCFECNNLGHYARNCPKRNNRSGSTKVGGSNDSKLAEVKFANAFSAQTSTVTTSSNDWFIDSGAFRHLTPRREILTEFIASSGHESDISIATNERLKVAGSGTAYVNIDGIDITIRNVLYVPGLGANLFSVGEMIRTGNIVTFDSNGCSVFNKLNEPLIKAKARNGVYRIEAKQIQCMFAANDDSIIDWHRRLGHLGYHLGYV